MGVLGSLLAPRLSLLVGGLAAVLTGWWLRFRPSPDARAWRRGAVGERRTARLLARLTPTTLPGGDRLTPWLQLDRW